MLENPGDVFPSPGTNFRVGGENPFIEMAEDFANRTNTTALAKAQAYATLAVAYELRELRKV